MNSKQLIAILREVRKLEGLTYRQQAGLAWCIAKLFTEV